MSISTKGGAVISAMNSLRALTTYVFLEQEQWFEHEVGFVHRGRP